jgi:hypothetical protein
MSDGIAKKKSPEKWAQAKARAKAKMGGKHSARAMQLATKYYKDSGGTYEGKKPDAKSNKMKKWTKERWTTKSGKNSTEGPNATGERYLPKKKIDAMSDADYKRTSDKKRRDTAKGKQWSKQPD